MTVFIDTGVLYAHHDHDASRHAVAVRALAHVLGTREYGRPVTSEYIFDEVTTLTLRRTRDIQDAIEVGRRIRGEGYPDAMEFIYSSPRLFDKANDIFERYSEHGLSFTDAMTVAIVRDREIDAVLTFDDDFDGIVDRLPPETTGN